MNRADAIVAMLNEKPCQYKGRYYKITAIIHRNDYRYEPEKGQFFAELENFNTGATLIEASGPKTGYPKEIPIKDIEMCK